MNNYNQMPVFLMPGVYEVREDKQSKRFYFEKTQDKFKEPNKTYGTMRAIATRIWNTYVSCVQETNESTGAIFTGDSGSGKSTTAQLICNYAISNGMPVIKLCNINPSYEFLGFITSLTRVVLFFDEFAKVFGGIQSQMLTLLSDLDNTGKLFIFTENNTYDINRYIKNAPDRALYHYDFSRVEKSVLEEYCYDMKVDPAFYEDLLDKYNECIKFSFSHLKAIVREHKRYPQDSLDDLLKIMNVSILVRESTYKIIKCVDAKTKKEIEDFYPKEFSVSAFDNGGSINIKCADGTGISKTGAMVFSNEDIVGIDENKKVTVTSDGIIITFVKNNEKIEKGNRNANIPNNQPQFNRRNSFSF